MRYLIPSILILALMGCGSSGGGQPTAQYQAISGNWSASTFNTNPPATANDNPTAISISPTGAVSIATVGGATITGQLAPEPNGSTSYPSASASTTASPSDISSFEVDAVGGQWELTTRNTSGGGFVATMTRIGNG